MKDAFILNLLQRVEICKAVTPCVDTPANTHNNQNVRACQRQHYRGGRLDRKHGCITVCHRPGYSTSGVSRTAGSVSISCNDDDAPYSLCRFEHLISHYRM